MLSTSNLIQPGGKMYELTGEQSNISSTAQWIKAVKHVSANKKCDYTIWSKKT